MVQSIKSIVGARIEDCVDGDWNWERKEIYCLLLFNEWSINVYYIFVTQYW